MLNKNSKILLTVYIGGKLGTPVSYKSTKEVVSKVKTSPYETQIITNGLPTGMYRTPKGHYSAPNDFVARELVQCTRNLNISGVAVMHMISDECPNGIKKNAWLATPQDARIRYHLHQLAEGNKFTFEVVE